MADKRLAKIKRRKCKTKFVKDTLNEFVLREPRGPKEKQSSKAPNIKEIKWKPVPVNYGIDFDGFGGIEELSNYGMISTKRKFSETDSEPIAEKPEKKKRAKTAKKRKKTHVDSTNDTTLVGEPKRFRLVNSPAYINRIQGKSNMQKKDKDNFQDDVKNEDVDMSRWEDLFVPQAVLLALKDLQFTAPTPIQAYTLPSAIRDRMDILGAAETGSGKTLAFAIPIMHGILNHQEPKDYQSNVEESEHQDVDDEGISIDEHTDISKENEQDNNSDCPDNEHDDVNDNSSNDENYDSNENLSGGENEDEAHSTNEVELPDIENGNERPLHALILTPTRELAIQVQKHIIAITKYTNIHVAVVVGGMAAEKQIRVLKKCPHIVVATPGRLWELIEEGNEHLNKVSDVKYLVIDEADRMVEKGHFEELKKVLDLMRNNVDKRQNFVFSATLTMVHDTPKRLLLKKKKYKLTQKLKLDSIMKLVGMKEKPKVVDITKRFGTADTLTEAKLYCNVEEKDAYLYYFCLTYPGRTLVFCNSIDCVRRLKNVFDFLNCHPLPLHSSMAQRQRLKNLDRFRNNQKSLLLATDVAARGLDIQNVQHVIHYQVPKTAETYVHRSGRTARALNEGLSLMLLSAQEVNVYRKLCRTLGRDKDLPEFPADQSVFASIQERVSIAQKLDVLSHRLQKKASQNSWLLQAAEKMDIDIEDGDLRSEVDENIEQNRKNSNIIKSLRKQLESLLKKSIAPRGKFTRYPTQSGKLNLQTITRSDSAILAVGKRVPWKEVKSENETKNNKGDKKQKKNKKKFWKPKSKTK